MKLSLILLLILMFNASCQEMKTTAMDTKADETKSQNQITESNDVKLRNTGGNNYSVYDFVFTEDNKMLGIGVGPTSEVIYISEDFGKSWRPERISSNEKIYTVEGITKNNGKVFITERGGSIWVREENQWQRIFDSGRDEDTPETAFWYLQFANDVIGFAINRTDYGVRIFKTQDGGKSWAKVYENPLSGSAFDLLVVDEKTAIVAMNDDYILRTEDGGKTWKPQELENTGRTIKEDDWIDLKDNGASDLTLTSDGTIWIVGERGSLYYSDDKGKTWKRPNKMPNTIRQQELKSIAFSTNGKGVAVGENGYIIISEDNGRTWNEISKNTLKENILKNDVTKNLDKLVKVKFDNEKAIVLGQRGVYEILF